MDRSQLRRQPAPQSTPPSGIPPAGGSSKGKIIGGMTVVGLAYFMLSRCSEPTSTETARSTYRAAAKELIKQRLRDPNSAEFTDMRVIEARSGHPTIVCGHVNARNGYGGMAGRKRFVVGGTVALEGEVSASDMDQLWARFC